MRTPCLLYLFFIFTLFFSCVYNNQPKLTNMHELSIVPKPKSVKLSGQLTDISLIEKVVLKNNNDSEKKIAKKLKKLLEPIVKISITSNNTFDSGHIIIDMNNQKNIPNEGYKLSIKEGASVLLEGSSYSGLFYGYQTFRQLCDPELEAGLAPKNTKVPMVEIEDSPVFGYRGMHLDVSRHFFDIDFIKTYIDMIALHKMNVFHWHLTDDNGWRIQIDKYPLLTEKAAWRIDRRSEPWKKQSPAKPNEKATYGGFYTKEQIREVVRYASEKNIMVIPEIELPGHTSEVFSAYPELSCRGEYIPVNPGSYWPNVDIFCAGNDMVFEFLRNVISEVAELFPGPYIHIGGDEADKLNWKSCNQCQTRIANENLKNEDELQSWFIKKVERFLVAKNKKLVGWDEILEGGLAKTATVMSWRGVAGGIEAARLGHDVIMCPTSHCYFDYYQADPSSSPKAFDGHITLKKVYSFNPIPQELKENEKRHILGAQGNLWTEYVQTPERAQYRVLPRMTALSEVLWSGPGKNTFKDFYFRLKQLQNRFDLLNWVYSPGTYKIEINANPDSTRNNYKINLSSEKPGEKIRYTLDGTNPTESSPVYLRPIPINEKTTVRAALFVNNEPIKTISEKTIYFSRAVGQKIKYNTLYSDRYSGSGKHTLVDGLTGSISHNDPYWQGWLENNFNVTIDLGEVQKLSRVSIGFLESHGSWIFLPSRVVLSFSKDNEVFYSNKLINIKDGKQNGHANRRTIESPKLELEARFINIEAHNRKKCPSWHPGYDSSGKTWIFVDEIFVE